MWHISESNITFVVVSQHTGCLCDAVIALLKVPLSFQRYFFQKLQSTSIKVKSSNFVYNWLKMSDKKIRGETHTFNCCYLSFWLREKSVNLIVNNHLILEYAFCISSSLFLHPLELPVNQSQCRTPSNWPSKWRAWYSTVQLQDSSGRSSRSASTSRPFSKARVDQTLKYARQPVYVIVSCRGQERCLFISQSVYFFSLSDSAWHQNEWDRAARGATQRLLQHPVPAELLHPWHSHRNCGGVSGGREWHRVENGAQDHRVCEVPGGSVLPAAEAPAAAGRCPDSPSAGGIQPLLIHGAFQGLDSVVL